MKTAKELGYNVGDYVYGYNDYGYMFEGVICEGNKIYFEQDPDDGGVDVGIDAIVDDPEIFVACKTHKEAYIKFYSQEHYEKMRNLGFV